jgi:uncharacterized protein
MIHKFSFSNFYSFKSDSEMDFTVNNHAPDTSSYTKTTNDNRITKLGAVFGHNASGKTNLLRVVPFIKWFITSSFNTKPDEEIPFKQFFFNKVTEKDTSFCVTFEFDKNIYEYSLSLTTKKIKTEKLKENNKELFSRLWNDEKKIYVYNLKNYGISKEFENLIRDNVSIISVGAQAKHALSIKIYKYWENIVTNITESGKSETDSNLFEASKIYYNNPKLKDRAEKMILQFDLGLSKIDVKERSIDKQKIYIPYGGHVLKELKEMVALPFWDESHGTINLFSLLPKIFECLENGSVIILDEFDADLHPQMLPVLIDLFISSKHNPNNAQLIFSSHSPQILNELDKYQIYFTKKDDNCSSCTWRLSEVEGVRVDDNYYAKYISGAYGAVPDIDLD